MSKECKAGKGKIVFLNPPQSLGGLYNELGEGGSELPPLGIAILAGVTRRVGYETKIIDASAMKMNYKETVNAILNENPDYLGITSTTLSVYSAAEVAKRVKMENDSITILHGGPHITAVPIETMTMFKDFDIGIIGEAEETIIELLENLKKYRKKDKLKGRIKPNIENSLSNVKGLVLRGKKSYTLRGGED